MTFERIMPYVTSGVHLRGALYFTIPVLGIVAERAAEFASKPPESWWQFVQLVCAATVAGLVALRAYIDQHIGNEKAKEAKQ